MGARIDHAPAAARWARELGAHLGEPVRVTFGRARRDVLVAKRGPAGVDLRLNEGFAEAPDDVRDAVARWLRSGRRARRAAARLDAFVEELAAALPEPARRRTSLRTRGAHHDLAALLPAARAPIPDGRLRDEDLPAITWGRRGRPRRSLRLGSYTPADHLVRVHPVLDQPGVPAWFVEVVLHHELLHVVVDREEDAAGRRRHHPPEFRRLERLHPRHADALRWEEEHLAALLRSARTGRPLPVPPPVSGWLFPEAAPGSQYA